MLTFEQITELVELVAQRNLQGLELERSGFRLKIDGTAPQPTAVAAAPAVAAPIAPPVMAAAPPVAAAPAPASAPQAAPAPAAAKAESEDDSDLVLVRSPIVGTFYRKPGPDKPPFVEAGDAIKPGQVLCIVEAMKLMNEIESEVSGVIARLLVEDGQAVEFDEPLFAVRPA